MKAIDIALKDLLRSLRSTSGLVFMFGIPLLVTGMFYFMLGRSAQSGEFELSRVQLAVANQDQGGPHLNLRGKNVPGNFSARTLGELVVQVLQSEDLADLVTVRLVPDANAARAAVDAQQAQVAVIIPPDFSRQFADTYGRAVIELYQDPTLTLSPAVIQAVMSQFMDGLSGVKIAVDIALEQTENGDASLVGLVVQQYMERMTMEDDNLAASLLEVSAPRPSPQQDASPLARILGPIMGGMMIFYAFYTGTASAESILREEEERTLPRLFTTPTPQSVILSGKFLAVFLTVLMQVVVLLISARFLFNIAWGAYDAVAINSAGIILSASAFGILVNSLLKDTRQGGMIFGGLLTITGMVGMIRVFAPTSAGAAQLGNSVSLLTPQGWAVKGLLLAMDGAPLGEVSLNALALLAWGAVFFSIGVWRFRQRYA